MMDNEALLLKGAELANAHTGYSTKFRFAGDYTDPQKPTDEQNRIANYILAIDAMPVGGKKAPLQFQEESIFREIGKVWVGL
jgi:hypothetical protein